MKPLLFLHALLLFCCFTIFIFVAGAQPYLDLVNTRASFSPGAGLINHNKEKINLSYYNISATVPLLLKNKKDAFILSPFMEKWHVKLALNNQSQNLYGLVLPVSFLKQVNSSWGLLFTAILRMNDSYTGFGMKRQAGGAIIFNKKAQKNLTYKFGAYVNGEYFGLFIMPLAGIDWQINDRNCLFGVLPGNLTYQHLISAKVQYGLTFRAQTNSYNRVTGRYIRIDENQLGAFFDVYLFDNIVLNSEIGHSLFRQIRTDQPTSCINGDCGNKYYDYKVNDNLYFKLSLAYRISLRK